VVPVGFCEKGRRATVRRSGLGYDAAMVHLRMRQMTIARRLFGSIMATVTLVLVLGVVASLVPVH
jgi:hypothetical protein